MTLPIVDSHVHLWTQAQLETLAWHTADNPLGVQHSVEEYLSSVGLDQVTQNKSHGLEPAAASQKYLLRGFIYLEVDRKSSVDEQNDGKEGSCWTHVLDEVSFLARIARGLPLKCEGHVESHKQMLLGFVPWAPVPGGPVVLERYLALVKERIIMTLSEPSFLKNIDDDDVWKKLRGVRYLVQDKPAGTMLQPGFVEGLKWLGRQQLAFDLGVDARQGGLWHLREAVELMRRVYHGVDEEDRIRIVINETTIISHPDFLEWKSLVTAMATASSTTYMKLSGLFSEFPSLDQHYRGSTEPAENEHAVIDYIVSHVRPWTDVIFDVFGPHRVMFGSDWPVCTIGNGAAASSSAAEKRREQGAWSRWRAVVEKVLDGRALSEDEKRDVWGGVAIRAYGIS
ncbi:hypothetical protein UA08_03896 [Talaromyces atroroseus]|uniref:Amidohydrolase-related domain-containing protein n=1 Tax=Talaromyces atroroseus TaxID=1441469 RepID=A0A225AIY1_TALAT|nr:hypothetical protein UA08_03896 [Talaromyces atroroseus]OKL61411.1 hypothetical protein UA08_03896 [Talaromyces atroroseus]